MDELRFAYFRISQLTWFPFGLVRKMAEYAGGVREALELGRKDLIAGGMQVTDAQYAQLSGVRDEEKMYLLYGRFSEGDTRLVTETDDDYPELLREIRDPPMWLYVRGELPPQGEDAVAVIGARRCSEYGREMAAFFGRELSLRGVHVVSGMASGVDGNAQKGAVRAQKTGGEGKTFAVLGGGTDICYPRENIALFSELRENGNGVISERPPGYHSQPYDFPPRNRIISGLCRAVLVIEAAEKSGTLITVNYALEQDREVFALPGRVSDRMSRGCNELIKNGAHVLTCPEDVLQILGRDVGKDTMKRPRAVLSREEEMIYEYLSLTPVSVDELLARSGLPAGVLMEILVRLEIKGVVRKNGISGYLRAL